MPAPIPANPPDIALNDREQIQYLLGGPPSWMMRYGIGVMAVFFVLLLAITWYFKYPDVLESKVIITTENPPIRVPAHTGGRIEYLGGQEGQTVQPGALLAVLENTANWKDVLRLDQWLQQSPDAPDVPPERLTLGELQGAYSTFSQHWEDYRYFQQRRSATARIAALQEQAGQLERINENLRRQNAILSEEFGFATTNRQRQQQLHSGKVISDQEFEKSETAWLGQKRQMAAAEASILQNEMQIKQLRQQMEEIGRTESDQLHDKHLLLAESRQQLLSALAAWKMQFLVEAPVAGRVTFPVVRSLHENLQTGDELLAIVPDKAEKTVARAQVAAAGIGRIRPGARAVISLDAWPAMQYGVLEGYVAGISALPKEEAYLISVRLPDSLVTTYGASIPLRQEMSGTVRMITEERRMLERIFDQVSDLLKNR